MQAGHHDSSRLTIKYRFSIFIQNLNEPCAIEDTSWIRPAKYMGIWWSLHIGKETWHEGPTHGATTENAKRHIDFAADHGLDALLIEGWNTGWDKWGAKGAFDYVTPYDDFDQEDVPAPPPAFSLASIRGPSTVSPRL